MITDARDVQKVRDLTQERVNAQNTLPVFSSAYYTNTVHIGHVFELFC